MIKIEIDKEMVKQVVQEEIERQVSRTTRELSFWDTPELKRRTKMSWNTIQEHFFHEPDFPKVKLGGKWYYPAKEAEAFLEKWIKAKMFKY